MFDKLKLKELLEKARGNRSNQEYADKSGVSRVLISNCLNLKLSNPPTPQTIEKLSNAATNGVSYSQLMEAAGYLDNTLETPETIIKKHEGLLPPEAIEEINNFIEFIKHKYKEKKPNE